MLDVVLQRCRIWLYGIKARRRRRRAVQSRWQPFPAGPAHRPAAPLSAGRRAHGFAAQRDSATDDNAQDYRPTRRRAQAVTVAAVVRLAELVMVRDARRRSASPATEFGQQWMGW